MAQTRIIISAEDLAGLREGYDTALKVAEDIAAQIREFQDGTLTDLEEQLTKAGVPTGHPLRIKIRKEIDNFNSLYDPCLTHINDFIGEQGVFLGENWFPYDLQARASGRDGRIEFLGHRIDVPMARELALSLGEAIDEVESSAEPRRLPEDTGDGRGSER